MDKDTRIELLKIVGMIIILVVLIWGIVWLNAKENEVDANNDINSNQVENEVSENTENSDEENSNTTEENETNQTDDNQ